MIETGETSRFCQNGEHFSPAICTDLQRLQIFTEPNNDQKTTITYSELPAITKITPTNHVPEILQQHFINTSTNPKVAKCRI